MNNYTVVYKDLSWKNETTNCATEIFRETYAGILPNTSDFVFLSDIMYKVIDRMITPDKCLIIIILAKA